MELKTCPFCGGEAELYISLYENGDTTQNHYVRCKDTFGCGASIWDAISGWQQDYDEAVQRLVDRWNRRVDNE